MISLGNLIGAVVGPAVYKKMHSFRIFAGLFCVAAAEGCFLGWRIQIPGLSMATYLVTGIVLGGIMPIYFSMPMILKGISQENVATASGLTTTFQLAGAVIVPSWLITPIAGSNYALIFTLAGVCMVAVLVMRFMGALTEPSEMMRRYSSAIQEIKKDADRLYSNSLPAFLFTGQQMR